MVQERGTGLRLLYLPNEATIGDQIGPRRAFERMLAAGELDDYTAYSYLLRRKELPDAQVWNEIRNIAVARRINCVLCEHIGSVMVPDGFLQGLRRELPGLVVAYHEGDVYGRIVKPLPSAMIKFARESDVVFLVGMGDYARQFQKAGCANVVYTPSFADTVRFGTPWVPTFNRTYDVVMIANRHRARLPFLSMPGHPLREKLARKLGNLLGDRFAVYGSGWTGFPGAKGSLPYELQEATLREAWVGVGLDSFPAIPYFFSDRLPIALLSGVTFVSSWQPGLEQLFTDGKHLVLYRTVDEAVQKIKQLLDGPRETLIELGRNGQQLAFERFTADAVMKSIVSDLVGRVQSKRHRYPGGQARPSGEVTEHAIWEV